MGRGQRGEVVGQASRRQLEEMRQRDLDNLDLDDEKRLVILRQQADRLEKLTAAGWPKRSEVGEKAALAAWLIAQHSPSPHQQQRFYRQMKEAVSQGEASQAHLAQLKDRILVRQGKPQLYGTQSRLDEKGRAILEPIADPDNLAERRRSVGLETLINL